MSHVDISDISDAFFIFSRCDGWFAAPSDFERGPGHQTSSLAAFLVFEGHHPRAQRGLPDEGRQLFLGPGAAVARVELRKLATEIRALRGARLLQQNRGARWGDQTQPDSLTFVKKTENLGAPKYQQ